MISSLSQSKPFLFKAQTPHRMTPSVVVSGMAVSGSGTGFSQMEKAHRCCVYVVDGVHKFWGQGGKNGDEHGTRPRGAPPFTHRHSRAEPKSH